MNRHNVRQVREERIERFRRLDEIGPCVKRTMPNRLRTGTSLSADEIRSPGRAAKPTVNHSASPQRVSPPS